MSVVTVTIVSEGQALDETHEVVSLEVSKEVNRIPSARLELLDGDLARGEFAVSNSGVFDPGKEIEIKLREGDDADATVFKGVVIRHGVEVGAVGSMLTVGLKDAAIKLTRPRKSAVFLDKTDDAIIGAIVKAAGLKTGPMAATKPPHAELVQHYSTDWDFMLSRADAQGLMVLVDDGSISLHEIAVKGRTHTFELGIDDIYDLELEIDVSEQLDSIESVAWDAKTQKLTAPSKAKAFKLAQGDLKVDKIAKAIGFGPSTLSHPVPLEPAELKAWADGRMAKSRMAMIRGRLAVPGSADIKPLDVVEIGGVGDRFNGKALVSGVRHSVTKEGWRTDLQLGLSPDRFCDQPDINDAPAAGLLPAVSGLQIGVIDVFEEDPDKEFRVKVILAGIEEEPRSAWARLATPDAGKDRGYFFRPETGDEVIVGFFNDDPRRPVVLGAMYGSVNTPPEDMSKLSEKNLDKGIVTKKGTTIRFIDDDKASVFIETANSNKILLDDDAEMIEIKDQHGNTLTLDANGIVMTCEGDLTLKASGNVVIEGAKVDVK